MKRFSLLLMHLVLLGSSSLIYAPISYLSLFEKGSKTIFIAGIDQLESENDKNLPLDALHKDLVFNCLKRLATQEKPLLCLVDYYRRNFAELAQSEGYLPLEAALPFYAQERASQDGLLTFASWDLRDDTLMAPTHFVMNMKHMLAKANLTFSSISALNAPIKTLALTKRSQGTSFCNGVSSATVLQYKQAINQLAGAKMTAAEEQQFKTYKNKAFAFCGNQHNRKLKEIFLDYITDRSKGLCYFTEEFENWMVPFARWLTHLSIKALDSKVAHYDNILAIAHAGSMEQFQESLERQGFVKTYSLSSGIDTQAVADAFHRFASNLGIFEKPLQLCAVCQKVSTQHCPCKQINYCSRECQVRDWKEHKALCPAAQTKK